MRIAFPPGRPVPPTKTGPRLSGGDGPQLRSSISFGSCFREEQGRRQLIEHVVSSRRKKEIPARIKRHGDAGMSDE
jgi:hypothetical protein